MSDISTKDLVQLDRSFDSDIESLRRQLEIGLESQQIFWLGPRVGILKKGDSMGGTTNAGASNRTASDLMDEAGSPDIEITPLMIQAGAAALGQAYDRFYDRADPYSYEAYVACLVFRAMVGAQEGSEPCEEWEV